MRSARLFLGIALSLFICTVAFADSIDRVSPASFEATTAENTMKLFGSGLAGNVTTFVTFDGPGGNFTIEVFDATSEFLEVNIPTPIEDTPGTYTVSVDAVDDNGTRHIGPASFVVTEPVVVGEPVIFTPEIVVAEATSRTGAQVFWVVTAFSAGGQPETPTCTNLNTEQTVSSGVLLPLGTTRVRCSVTDTFGTASGEFLCFVTDSTPPVLHLPTLVTSTTTEVNFSVSATDTVDGNLPVTCSPSSGSAFDDGTTLVQCSATDSHNNVATGSFNVVVSTTAQFPPSLSLPDDIFIEATGPGTVVTYTATTDANAQLSCSPASGSLFPLHSTPVNCTASFGSLSTSGTFTVNVVDTTPPVLHLPSTITSSNPVVNYSVTATDLVDTSVSINCNPASGSTFTQNSTTIVRCTAVDFSGNTTQGNFNVTIVNDTTPPVLSLPADITAEATGPNGAIVTYVATANDETDGPVAVSCDPSSGSVFALGTTTVTCSAHDIANNSSSGTFHITVVDTTPPAITVPADITAEATSAAGAVVPFTASATDLVDGSRPVTCTPPSGSTFPLGTTTVQCTSTDLHGNTGHRSFNINVVDTTPPVVTAISASPDILWPPNHTMTAVTVSVTASDLVDQSPTSQIVSVTSNQPINGTGDGDIAPDWEITGAMTVNLRAERAQYVDRIYTITVATSDFSGNTTTSTVQVRVANTKSRGVHH